MIDMAKKTTPKAVTLNSVLITLVTELTSVLHNVNVLLVREVTKAE